MPRASSVPRTRRYVQKTLFGDDVADPIAPDTNDTATPMTYAHVALRTALNLAWPAMALVLLAWLSGAAHWIAMFTYNGLECHRAGWSGLLWSPLDQGRPECVLLWRVANSAHWSLFDLFGKILAMVVPNA